MIIRCAASRQPEHGGLRRPGPLAPALDYVPAIDRPVLAQVSGMSSEEPDHGRGRLYMHTGYRPAEKLAAEAAKWLMTQVYRGTAALLKDLKDRGRLDTTLVVWMRELGRTPQVNRNGGRDHYSRARTTVMEGGGVKGGLAVGRTEVTPRPWPNAPLAPPTSSTRSVPSWASTTRRRTTAGRKSPYSDP